MTSHNAVRQARFRDRQRDNCSVYRIEVERDAVLEALVATGRLLPAETLSRDRVEQELSLLIMQWATER
jgi:hypothetical protein